MSKLRVGVKRYPFFLQIIPISEEHDSNAATKDGIDGSLTITTPLIFGL